MPGAAASGACASSSPVNLMALRHPVQADGRPPEKYLKIDIRQWSARAGRSSSCWKSGSF